MTVSAAFQAEIASRSSHLVVVAELYPEDVVPGADGPDPHDAIACLASVGGIEFQGQTYLREVSKFSDITITDDFKFNNGSLTISNVDRWIAAFDQTYGIEGLYKCFRIISTAISVDLDDTYVYFFGRCDKPGDADKKQMPISAKELLGSVDTQLPPRVFSTSDEQGRRANDPLFEGFRSIPALWTVNYGSSEPKGGILGSLFGLTKKVTKTFQASSHSALDISKPVPIVFGRAQMQSQHIGYGDFGNSIAMLSAWAEGLTYGIYQYQNIRNVDAGFTALIRNIADTWMHPTMNAYLTLGDLGQTGTNLTAPIAGTVAPLIGLAPFSRTAWSYSYVNGSQVGVDDAAPLLLSIIYGNKMPTLIEEVDWTEIAWSDCPIDHARMIITDQYLLNINPAFIDDEANLSEWNYCQEVLVDEVNTDTLVMTPDQSGIAGVDYNHWKSTGGVTPDWYKWLNGESVFPFENEADYIFEDRPPIENGGGGGGVDPTNPDPNPDAPTKFRRRYTSNIAFTEQQKSVDALQVIYNSARMFHTYSPAGKIQFKVKRPADNTLFRSDVALGVTEIPVYSVLPWRTNPGGDILIGSDTVDGRSEVRRVSSPRYTTAGNSITLTASGGVTASGATFSGGDNLNTPATASLSITTAATKTITIDGIPVIVSQPGGTTATISGLIKDAINSHSILSFYIKASWVPGSTTVSLESKLGFLVLATATEFAHDGPIASPITEPTGSVASGGHLAAGDWFVAYSYELPTGETRVSNAESFTVTANQKIEIDAITPPADVEIVNWFVSRQVDSEVLKFYLTNDGSGFDVTEPPLQTARFAPQANTTGEEVTRMDFVFTDRALTRTNLTRANIIADSFKWPLGSRQPSINQVIGKYREAVEDFRPTELRINDSRHQAKVGKKLPFELNLAAVDNFHQACRLTNGCLAEKRDADRFAQWGGGAESLLIEIGQVGCVSDFGSGVVNQMVRLEEKRISWSGHVGLNFIGRVYSSSLYDDDVYEKMIPMPSTLTRPMLRTGRTVEVTITGGAYELSRNEANADGIKLVGTLASNATVQTPDGIVRTYVVNDATVRGGFTLTWDTVTTSTPVVLAPGHNGVEHLDTEIILS